MKGYDHNKQKETDVRLFCVRKWFRKKEMIKHGEMKHPMWVECTDAAEKAHELAKINVSEHDARGASPYIDKSIDEFWREVEKATGNEYSFIGSEKTGSEKGCDAYFCYRCLVEYQCREGGRGSRCPNGCLMRLPKYTRRDIMNFVKFELFISSSRCSNTNPNPNPNPNHNPNSNPNCSFRGACKRN